MTEGIESTTKAANKTKFNHGKTRKFTEKIKKWILIWTRTF